MYISQWTSRFFPAYSDVRPSQPDDRVFHAKYLWGTIAASVALTPPPHHAIGIKKGRLCPFAIFPAPAYAGPLSEMCRQIGCKRQVFIQNKCHLLQFLLEQQALVAR